ncbi:hypothetical protein POM88_047323 [Heracleum sosnowskyi]|uniref:Uncharacterized protein n=1 Tax=Heracleum sosnowskyi TaxID=360622 RepID=A0AAD8GRY0_9APIA|nr:hypothetical protein POM88_047323 [Heracleum sosnowskyi]
MKQYQKSSTLEHVSWGDVMVYLGVFTVVMLFLLNSSELYSGTVWGGGGVHDLTLEANLVRLAINALQGVEPALISINKICTVFFSDPADRTYHRIPKFDRDLGEQKGSKFEEINLSESGDLVNQAFAVSVGKILEGYTSALDTLHASAVMRRLSKTFDMSSCASSGAGLLTSVAHSEVKLLEVYLHTEGLRTQIDALGNICHLHDIDLCRSASSFEDLGSETKFSEFPSGAIPCSVFVNAYKSGYVYVLQVSDPAHSGDDGALDFEASSVADENSYVQVPLDFSDCSSLASSEEQDQFDQLVVTPNKFVNLEEQYLSALKFSSSIARHTLSKDELSCSVETNRRTCKVKDPNMHFLHSQYDKTNNDEYYLHLDLKASSFPGISETHDSERQHDMSSPLGSPLNICKCVSEENKAETMSHMPSSGLDVNYRNIQDTDEVALNYSVTLSRYKFEDNIAKDQHSIGTYTLPNLSSSESWKVKV